MRSLMGLLWALGGGVVGVVVGVLAGFGITQLAHTPSREGEAGYLMLAVALLGAVVGIVLGIVLYGRRAPAGQAIAYAGSSTLGVIGLVVALAVALWAYTNFRETPATYGGAMADLLLELRVKTSDAPPPESTGWLSIEVQTPKTRPEGNVSWSSARTADGYRIIPVTQGPLSRTSSRFIVVRVEGRQVEVFSPPMPRTPNPNADWSEWYRPNVVDPPNGVTPPAALRSIVELRYRIRVYGQ